MTQYKLSNSQLNKLRSRVRNSIEETLKIWSNVIGDSNEENNFQHKLLLTNTRKKFQSLLKLLQVIPQLI